MSQQKNAKRKRSAPIPDIKPTIFDKTDVAGIKDAFDKNGFAVVWLYDKQQCSKHIAEIVRKILVNQPWMRKLVVNDSTTGEILDIDRDEEKFVEEFTKPDIPKETLEHYNDVWPMHKAFGACCDPSAFHLNFQWELRQDESLYAIARAIMQEHKIHSNIDRAIEKLPGNGMPELLHWDFPIFDVDCRPLNEKQPSISMKICFTEAEFIAVPGTHTRKFAEEFKLAYEPLYPKAKNTDAKFGLDPEKADPMGLRDQKVSVKLPAGSAIILSPYLMHRTNKSSVHAPISLGTYAGFTRKGNRTGYTSDEPGITSEQ
jgi:ectoine hydroxylase-related dioxygenase (phytanoyl-CoA dioxygenase family)